MVLLLFTEGKGSEYVFPPLPNNIANESEQSREKGNDRKVNGCAWYHWWNQLRFLINTQTISALWWSQSGLDINFLFVALYGRITLPFAVCLLWSMGGCLVSLLLTEIWCTHTNKTQLTVCLWLKFHSPGRERPSAIYSNSTAPVLRSPVTIFKPFSLFVFPF